MVHRPRAPRAEKGRLAMNGSDWSDAMIARFRKLHADPAGLSYGEIAKRLGVSKGAVAGKRSRLGLPPRGAPICPIRPGAAREARARRAAGAGGGEAVVDPARGRGYPARLVRSVAPVPDAPPPVARPVVPPRAAEGCRYPLWGTGRPDHRYCDAPRATDAAGFAVGAYCAAHRKACYLTDAQYRAQQQLMLRDARFGLKRAGQ
jgi:hypothetical protein